MAEKRIRDCIQRVGDAERKVAELRVVEQQLLETRETLEQLLTEPGILTSKGQAQQGLPAEVDEAAMTANQITLLEKDDKEVAPGSLKHEATQGKETEPGQMHQASLVETMAKLRGSDFEVSPGQKAKEEALQAMLEGTPAMPGVNGAPGTAATLGVAATLGLSSDEVSRAFRCFSNADKDDSGKVDKFELHKLFEMLTGSSISTDDTDLILSNYDKNQDGSLDFEEFLACFCSLPEKKRQHLQSAMNHGSAKLGEKFRAQVVGVQVDDLKNYLQKELDQEAGFLQIPVIFALFFFFVVATSLHRNTSISNSIENGIRFDIQENANFAFVGVAPFENGRMGHKSISDVNSYEDFWSWLDIGLVPIFFPSGWGVSEPRTNVAARCTSPLEAIGGNGWTTSNNSKSNTPYGSGTYAAVTGDLGSNICKLDQGTSFPKALSGLAEFADAKQKPYLYFNEIVAGMRMRQEQMAPRECQGSELFGKAYRTSCFDVNNGAWLPPDLDTALLIDDSNLNKPGGETVYFKSGTGVVDVHRHIRDLENKRWVNPRTAKIELTFTLYNNQMNVFVTVFINFFFSRGGHIHKVIKPVAIWLDPYQNPASYVIDILFALLVLKLFLEEAREVFRSTVEHGVKKGLHEYFYNFSNAIDWASLSYSVVIFVMWAQWCVYCSKLKDILQTADAKIPGSWPGEDNIYTPTNTEYWDAVDTTTRYGQHFQVVLAFFPFVIGMRFFSSFSAQPRLGLVTATLSAASNDLLHFGFVLGVTIMIFCSSAVILFGREVEEFENFGRTYVSVFRGLLGDLDYVPLTEVGRLPAMLWFMFFMVFVNMVMVNMLLAIIMDVYGSVKSGISDNVEDFPTMFSQTREIIRRGFQKRAGTRLSIHHVLRALDTKDDECYITTSGSPDRQPRNIAVSLFMKLVDKLDSKQAERLIGHAIELRELEDAHEGDIADVISTLNSLQLRMQYLQQVSESVEATAEKASNNAKNIDELQGEVKGALQKMNNNAKNIDDFKRSMSQMGSETKGTI